MTLVATIMLLSRAAIMGFLVAMIIYLIRSYPKLINLILLSFFIVCSLIIFYIEYIFETNGLILDALSSGRFRLWYYASDQGTYELFSTKLQDDENLTYLTKKSGHDTAYLHNSYLYTLLNFGKVYYFCFIIILIYVSNRLLYFRDSLIFILMMYIIFCSFFESLLDFQKLGLLFYSLIFFILKMDYRYMKRESVCD